MDSDGPGAPHYNLIELQVETTWELEALQIKRGHCRSWYYRQYDWLVSLARQPRFADGSLVATDVSREVLLLASADRKPNSGRYSQVEALQTQPQASEHAALAGPGVPPVA